jgi:hypothetical protein
VRPIVDETGSGAVLVSSMVSNPTSSPSRVASSSVGHGERLKVKPLSRPALVKIDH